jgi:V8-like Glu-specific endopeptidase
MKRGAIALAVAFFALTVAAQQQDGFYLRDAVGVKSYAAAPRLAERADMVPAVVLPSAASTVPEELLAIREWNAGGREPMRNGFKRMLPDLIDLRLSSAMAAKSEIRNFARGMVSTTQRGSIIWSTVVKVEKAHRLRLHLENVTLPEGATLWVYGAGETPTGFGRELLDDNGNIWTPSVHGELVYLEVEVPSANATTVFAIREVLELVELKHLGAVRTEDEPTCLVDSTCVASSTFTSIANARRATAHLEFVTSSGGAVCTGGLLNDRNSTGTPYMLTANHCFSSQGPASSLESFFDFQTTSCNGSFNGANALRTVGAQWLASSASSDFTFVKLNSIPGGRFFLGWNAGTSAVPGGTTIHRVSHPVPAETIFPQMYSSTVINTTVGFCPNIPRPNFLYSTGGVGGVYGGSSGSPVMLANGQVVGQLLGSCGPTPESGCDPLNSTVDGAFSSTYPSISSFLEGGSPGQPTVCTQNATTLCLVNNRFAVSATFRTNDSSGTGQAVRLTSDTGYFWFFGSSNVEVVIKVLDACGFSQRFWVFAGGLTNVNVVLTVIDTKNGTVKTYTNPINTAFLPIQDTGAFATCP